MNNWGTKKLRELANINESVLSSSIKPNYEFYYVDISCVSECNIDYPKQAISFKNAPSRARIRVKKDDVLMATVRPNLKSFAYFGKEGKDFVASTGFAVLTAKENVNSRFILYSILSDSITRQINNLIVGSNYPAINTRDVLNLEIHTPQFKTQTKIAKILTTVDNVGVWV